MRWLVDITDSKDMSLNKFQEIVKDISPVSSSLHLIFIRFVYVLVPKSHVTLCNPMDCNPPGSSVHGIFQARILEWVAISYTREFS